jgi:exodeoxyribonuclease VII small subunit
MTTEAEVHEPIGDDAQSLEARLQRLEEIVRSLETSDLELERALALFEEGVGHARSAEQILKNAELRVEELLGTAEEPVIEPLEEDPE